MYPQISAGMFEIPTFSLCAIAGVCAFVFLTLIGLRKTENPAKEAYYILPKLFISLGVGYIGAIFFDALFKIPENGGFKISGITFYGGIATGVAVLAAMLAIFKKNTRLGVLEWLNLLTLPFLSFHFFGRIGCFLGGCCYGKVTQSVWGVAFPDNPRAGIFHNGEKVFPTQLFEAAAIAVTALCILKAKHKFALYCFLYPAARFFIEFLRGDDRGSYLGVFSPAQIFSIAIVTLAAAVIIARIIRKNIVQRRLD